MGCGTSRSQESRPSSPPAALQPGGGVNEAKEANNENKVKVVEDEDQEEVLELKLFEGGNSTKGLKSFKLLALTQTKFVQQISSSSLAHNQGSSILAENRHEVSKGGLNWKNEIGKSFESRMTSSFDEEDEGPEIIDLQPTLAQQNNKHSTETQTDPVLDEVFDWDLSDRTDCETQTTPPSRVNSTNMGALASSFVQDALVQTDQRLVFLLHRSSAERIKKRHSHKLEGPADMEEYEANKVRPPTLVDVSCQTYVQMEEIGIQVDPSEFDNQTPDMLRHRRYARPFSSKSSVPEYSSEFFEDDDDEDFKTEKDAIVQVVSTSGNHLETDKKRRILRKMGPGYFKALNDSDFSDPDEILVVKGNRRGFVDENSVDDFMTGDDRGESRSPTLYDAGFQVNMVSGEPMAATASTRSRQKDISSPVGQLLQKSLHLGEDEHQVPHIRSNGKNRRRKDNKIDVGIQTDNDIVTDESPDFQARPPTIRKYELIGENPELFHQVDAKVREVSEKWFKSLKRIVRIIDNFVHDTPIYDNNEELAKVRAFWLWTAENIRYDWSCMDRDMSTRDILKEKVGVCRQYVKIFSEMCQLANIRVKCLRGFAKGHTYTPGHPFVPGEGIDHAWNAVFISGSWRLLDCTWGAGKTDALGHHFKKQLDEHFFLTDPDELIYTHFPFDESEENYNRWQLLDNPISLDEFNALPMLASMFFEYSLNLDPNLVSPIIVHESTSIVISAWEAIRYKFKFFPVNKPESDYLNTFVLCYLKGRQRQMGHFQITPPEVGDYFLKIYAKPEAEIFSEHDTLDHVATFLIHAQQVKSKALPLPRCDLPWGVTQAFFETEARLVNQPDPVITMIGNQTKEFVLRTPKGPLLTLCHIYDSDNNELVIDDDRGTKYTVLLNRKNPLPTLDEDDNSLLPFITKRETPEKIVFLIDPLPKPGFYKLQIYGRKKPKARGRLKIPLIANFLVDFRLNGGNKGAGMQAGRTASAALLNSGRSSLVAQLQQRSSSMNSKISQQGSMVRSESMSSGLVQRDSKSQSKRGSLTSVGSSRVSPGQDGKVTTASSSKDRSNVYRLSAGSKSSQQKDLSEISVT